jgi:hypothetical protein
LGDGRGRRTYGHEFLHLLRLHACAELALFIGCEAMTELVGAPWRSVESSILIHLDDQESIGRWSGCDEVDAVWPGVRKVPCGVVESFR